MRYRPLGRWGLQVSAVGLGSWLTFGGSVEEDAATACIDRAYEAGVNFFDTANSYSGGRAEEVMGTALKRYPRSSCVIATKVFNPMGDGPNERGLSRKHIREQSEASLQRLGIDYIDLYQCHRYDPRVPLEETCQAMDDLIRAGKVLYWGVSEWTADQIAHAVSLCRGNGWSLPVSNQPQYSALWRRIEQRVLPTSVELGLGQVVWSPLAMGVLTGKYTSVDDVPEGSRAAGEDRQFMRNFLTPETLAAVQRLRPVAQEAGVTMSQLALAWCLRQTGVSSVIVGASKPSHVDDNVAAADLHLDRSVFDRVDELLSEVAHTS